MKHRVSFSSLAIILLVGCVTTPPTGGRAPQATGPGTTYLRVETYKEDGLDLPVGAYRIAGTSYVILRQEHGAVPGGGLLGPLGLLAGHAAGQQQGKETSAQYLRAFDLDLGSEAKSTLRGKLDATTQLLETPGPRVEPMEITPYVWIGTYKNGQSRVHVVLEARLKDKSGETKWWNKYIHYSDETHPLSGDRGWMADNGALIKSASRRGMEIAATALLGDIRGTLRRVDKKARYTAPFMAFAEPVALEGVLLSKDQNVAIVETRIAWAGVNIFPAREVSVLPGN